MALGTNPHLALAIGTQLAKAGVGFDVALMGGFGLVGLRAHHISGGKACVQIAVAKLHIAHDVGVQAGRHRMVSRTFADHGCAGGHGSINVGDMGQHFVGHFDQLGRVLGQEFRGRSNGGNGMAVIQRLFPGKGVFLQVQVFARQARGQIGAGDNGLDPVQRQRLGGVDLEDPRMGMGRAHDSGMQHAGGGHIGAVARAARHLVQPVGAVRSGADQAVTGGIHVLSHHAAPRISAAASITARMILSYPVQRQRLPASQ